MSFIYLINTAVHIILWWMLFACFALALVFWFIAFVGGAVLIYKTAYKISKNLYSDN